MKQAWAPLLFDDDDRESAQKAITSPVSPAQRSPSAKHKAATLHTQEGLPVHSFQTLLNDLATVTKTRIKLSKHNDAEIEKITTPTPLQKKALNMIGATIM